MGLEDDHVRESSVPVDRIKPASYFRFYEWLLKKLKKSHLLLPLEEYLVLDYHEIVKWLTNCPKCQYAPLFTKLMKEKGEDHWELLEVCQAFDLVPNLWKRNREVAMRLLDEWAEQDGA
jgi:thiol-disulfide isomerase/thioredoxin